MQSSIDKPAQDSSSAAFTKLKIIKRAKMAWTPADRRIAILAELGIGFFLKKSCNSKMEFFQASNQSHSIPIKMILIT